MEVLNVKAKSQANNKQVVTTKKTKAERKSAKDFKNL